MNPLFYIHNLTCTYPSKKETNTKSVLEIQELTITRGQISMFLGKSGIGKSTILEAFGLMNNTIRPSSQVDFYPYANNKGNPYKFSTIWTDKKDREIAAIRNLHFSFIFQSTNLMPNFTIRENIYISQLLQGKSKAAAAIATDELLKKIKLEGIEAEQKIYELSGGQRQRVAFARAILPNYTVLFGDEPTGNLDSATSRDLMQIIQQDIEDSKAEAENNKYKTAIIVTHNIDLALQFADQIVVLTEHPHPEKKKRYGEIIEEMVFKRLTTDKEVTDLPLQNWLQVSTDKIYDGNYLKEVIQQAMQQDSLSMQQYFQESISTH